MTELLLWPITLLDDTIFIYRQISGNFSIDRTYTFCSGKDYKKACEGVESDNIIKGVLRWLESSPEDVNQGFNCDSITSK